MNILNDQSGIIVDDNMFFLKLKLIHFESFEYKFYIYELYHLVRAFDKQKYDVHT